ncbi:MAG TPA: glycosyl hydrolase family 79 C-terminal domain-containing protein [Solirubrobacteraceae bacterium]|jgi:hypothetical protein|nr:glycosyl hydrolase family 79 C-terminal domain-containing protein [Solirubrobacteraceae bacterium]
MLRAAAVAAVATFAALLTWSSAAGASNKRASQPVPTSLVTVTTNALQPVPTSFLGLSMNVDEMEAYTQQQYFPNFVRLITPDGDGPFVLRVGGTYADTAYWNGESSHVMPQYVAPTVDQVTLNDAWLQSLAEAVYNIDGTTTSGANVIFNVNAAAHDPQMALNVVEAMQRVFQEYELPSDTLSAVAIGNEPNLYSAGYLGITRNTASWVKNFSAVRYDTLYSLYANVLKRRFPSLTLAGPELSAPTSQWLTSLIQHDPGQVGMATEHYYAYSACAASGSSAYPAIYRYFRPTNISQATAQMEPAIQAAHSIGVPYRLTELGSSTCLGLPLVTDTFGTSLWALDQLFQFISAGVDGVNFHLRAAEPNSAIHTNSAGLSAEPLMYGIAAFSSMLGPDAQLEQVTGILPSNVKVWAVQSGNGWSLALINDTTERERVRVAMPTSVPMTVKALTAPSPWSGSATFGGQTISSTGCWQGTANTSTVTPVTGDYSFTIPPDSAEIAYTQLPAKPCAS